MEFERGSRCSNCGNSTVEMDEKGFTCENELCGKLLMATAVEEEMTAQTLAYTHNAHASTLNV